MGKARPALDIRLPTTHDPNLIELVFARLDDFQPTALQEGDGGALLAFFSSSCARDAALGAIVSGFASRGVSGRTLDVDDEDWAARSQAELRAVEVGCMVVAPPWDVPTSVRAGVTTIVIDPSMGFGTGHHESTRLCLHALQRIDLHGREVLDIGTGSGVLAIAAALLGANHAAAIDVDPDALQSARENAARNGVESRITFEQADFRDARLSAADIVLANLTGAVVCKTFGRLVELAAPAGALILSGFTHDERGARPDGFIATSPQVKIVEQLDEEGWRCFVLRRCSPFNARFHNWQRRVFRLRVKLRRTAIAFGGGGQTRLSLGGSKDPPLHDRLPGAGKNPGPRPPRLGITAARRTPSTRARRPQSSTVPTPSAG